MAISAKDVKELRERTGAGMMDCKKALTESGGDFEGALEELRKKGQKVKDKRADRDANEGVVVAKVDGDRGAILALSCETDFVAKNEGFVALANQILDEAFAHNCTGVEDVMKLQIDGEPIEERLTNETGKTGEKIEVRDFRSLQGSELTQYIHAGSKIGVLVAYKGGGKDNAPEFFRGVAMHIAAMNPSGMTPDEFDDDLIQKETVSIQEQIKVKNEDNARLSKPLQTVPQYVSRKQLTPEVMAAAETEIKEGLKAEGKPEKIWDKIVPGKLARFVADNTLLDQERCLMSQFYALDEDKTVEQAVAAFDDDAEVVQYHRVSVG